MLGHLLPQEHAKVCSPNKYAIYRINPSLISFTQPREASWMQLASQLWRTTSPLHGDLTSPAITHLVLHMKEVARDLRLAANEGAFRRAPFRTIRLAFGLHARRSKQGRKDHTGSSTQEGNSTQKNLHSEAESNRSAGQ